MGNLLLRRSVKAVHPYYVEELGIHLYTAEELSYFIYNNYMLLDGSFIDSRLMSFIEDEIKLTELADKIRRWRDQASFRELLIVILQDIRYCSNHELMFFQQEMTRISKEGPELLLKEKADYLVGIGHIYEALKIYDKLLVTGGEVRENDELRVHILCNRAAAFVRLYAFDKAFDSLTEAYGISGEQRILYKLYTLYLAEGETGYRNEYFDKLTEEEKLACRSEYELQRQRCRMQGRAAEIDALLDKDSKKRNAGLLKLLEDMKDEYRRCQGY